MHKQGTKVYSLDIESGKKNNRDFRFKKDVRKLERKSP